MNQKTITKLEPKKKPLVKRKPVKINQDSLIETSHFLPSKQSLPLVVKPRVEGLNLVSWVEKNREFIEKNLDQYGAILWRNFGLQDIAKFEQLIQGIWGDLLDYTYRSTPRSQVRGKIHTSTEYPAHQTIPLHNEMAYSRNWPLKIAFFCRKAASKGGATPIADSRLVLKRLDPQIVSRFEEKKIMYVRNYGDGLDLSWQNVFQTNQKSVVENYCRQQGIDWEWKEGDRLKTRQVCQAIAIHPQTRDKIWFNQAHLFHISSLEPKVRDLFLSEYQSEELPRNAYYGDGTAIDSSTVAEIRHCYQQEMTIFPWQSGDILMLDNMLTCHGRMPYVGQRQVVVGMGQLYSN
ncbi:TauD/TfdA family dioxygenase [Okeania sp. KiyG1]|uniref:TauD/TfdA family dioxygenase n=1 Tax=Okeania sp. KiyG1 TaxID=2720165 RepID=UPI001924599E|nr:TauD/TfdA family dioxygenase [Okeania sp. KiyG1]GGA11474.1 hypothetical protein CYANOKiyG1_24390 [Okeania sp. KiyG1]GGA18586.1 hypothetical protein CYANOKiyG1_33100 [Okeania sp. KiyG1]